MPTTRAALRRMVGNLLGDVTELAPTALGTTTTLIDTISLSSNIEHPRNRDIVFTVGNALNVGVVRRVVEADLLSGTIQFDAIPITTGAGSTERAEMYNFRGKGWRINEYNSAINQAIREAGNGLYKDSSNHSVPLVDILNSDSIDMSGSGMTHVYAIQNFVSGTTWNTIRPADRRNGYGWWADNTPLIQIEGYAPTLDSVGANELVVYGFTKPTELTEDTQSTNIPADWLSNKVAEILCMSALDRDQGNFARGQNFARAANMALPSIRTRVPGTTRMVNGA